jgi:hypothetical protein
VRLEVRHGRPEAREQPRAITGAAGHQARSYA